MSKNSLTIKDNRNGKEYTIPVEQGAVKATDLKNVRVYDNGFQNTAVCKSAITQIDGGKGILLYRGYPIEQLAEQSNFLEVAYLVIYGELPDAEQYAGFSTEVMRHTMLHENTVKLLGQFNYDAHPFSMMISSIASLGASYPESNPALAGTGVYNDPKVVNKQILRLIGKSSTLAAACYRHRIGRGVNLPQNHLSYSSNMLYMMDHLSEPDYVPNPKLAACLDKLFILHIDHELCASTAGLRHILSSKPDVFSAVSGAASSLYGPLHGGAAQECVQQFQEIGKVENVAEFMEQVKARKRRCFGLGHRVYKTKDPRSVVIRKVAEDIFNICGRDPLIEVALEIERVALNDDYFVSRKLYPNVDFFSGLCYRALGLPLDFYPVMFLVPRIVGWCAHFNEQLGDKEAKIWRPRQIYIGEKQRNYVPMGQRQSARLPNQTTNEYIKSTADRHPFSKRTLVASWKGKPQSLNSKL